MLAIAHYMHEGSDVNNLSLTSRFFSSLVRSPDLVAAWLWERHGNEAMLMAMRNEDMAVLRQLVEVQHADVNALLDDGDGLLIGTASWASSNGNLEYVKYLLSIPEIQVNLRDSDGWTALHHAYCLGQWAIVRELLQHPAVDVSIRSNAGFSVLFYACTFHKSEVVVELLGHHGMDVNQTLGPHNRTCLHVECACSNVRMVKELLKHPDIRVNQKTVESNDEDAMTASQYCLFGGHAD